MLTYLTIVINVTIITSMRKRIFWLSHCIVSLAFGAVLYLVFRESTYLHTILRCSVTEWANVTFIGSDIVRYFLPDFLWAYSLCCGLYGIALPTEKKLWLPPLCVVGLGIIWECFQWFGVVKGTGDVLDVLSYGLATAVVVYINIRKEGKL